MKEKAAYLKGLIDGLGIDENTKEGKVIKAMSELLSEMAETVDSIDEDVTHAYLGMVGAEFKAARKVILRHLSGNSAFRKVGDTDAVSE